MRDSAYPLYPKGFSKCTIFVVVVTLVLRANIPKMSTPIPIGSTAYSLVLTYTFCFIGSTDYMFVRIYSYPRFMSSH